MKNNLTYTMAFWLLRFWLAARAIGTGLTKFQGKEAMAVGGEEMTAEEMEIMMEAGGGTAVEGITEMVNVLGFGHYHALPEKGPMSMEAFYASPLMPNMMVKPYAFVLGFALIGLGVALLAGICTRISLFLMGLLYISLSWGFIILEPTMGSASAAGIAYLGVHMLAIVAALLLADYNKFELLPCKKFKMCKCASEQSSCNC